ncbi:small membrane protein YkgR [Escherichia coli]
MSDKKKESKEHMHNMLIKWVVIFAALEYIYLFIKFF